MLRGASGKKGAPPRILAVFLCVILAAPLSLPGGAVWGHNDTGRLVTEQPVLLVSGDALIEGGEYTAANVSNEKSYTLEELLTLDGLITEKLYSAINSSNTRRIYRSEGVDVSGLLALSKYTGGGAVTTIASDGNRVSFDMDTPRYYFPNIGLGTFGGMNESNGAGGEPVTAMLAFRTARSDKGAGAAAEVPLIAPPAEAMQDQALQLQLGQLNVRDVNNSLFNGGVNKLLAGAEITGKPVTVLGTAYTRAQMMMMPRAEGIYTYISSGGERNDRVRGVPLEYLLGDIGGSTAIEFKTADNWGGITAYNMTKAELVAKDAVLAYEMWNQASGEWEGVFSGSGSTRGYFRLYLSGERPAQGISDISVKASHASEYKHINHAGAPYNLDSITGATLTVEGPGVENSVPVTVRQLEETADGNIHKGAYEDLRGGNAAGRMYEGVKVLSILEGLVNPNVIPLDDKVVVVFKNRWRQEVARMSYDEIKNASSPVILAYGTAYTDESKISPFVFIQGAGADSALGNEDGPLKLIYNQGMFPSRQFPSIAYMYVEEGVPPPGFKHITATNEAYNNVENTEFILTFTGDELGKEVNYTVRELEELATANAALSHRDEYSLSNTTYWYVNEYEGIKLWDLLVGMGVNAGKADTGGSPVDNTPLVSFASWDNYQISSQFSFHQLARPELFYFYEKSPLDIGTDRPSKQQLATEEYQPDNQVGDWVRDANNYPVKAGYPVLLAYGVNSYPYVRNPGMEGFKSGLGNSGGPMRLIYGKTDGLNRANPNAEENYAYFFNNGSQQLQRVEEIYVGNNTRYSTHMQNPAQAYQAMKDQQALTVEVIAGGSTLTTTFTLTELESILYGEGVTKRDRDNEGRREKGYYYYRDAGGSPIEDLFEGVNLEYLLTEHIGMQGLLGTVELYNVGGTPAGIYDLSDFGAKGQNSMREVKGLGPMVAFAKNGYPLVAGSNNSGNTSPGYVHDDGATGKAIRNGQGPLLFVRGQTGAEAAAKRIEIGVENRTYVDSLTKIVVNLDPDPYAHTGSEHAALAGQRVNFSGSVAQTGGVSFTVGALETKQRYIVDDEYTIGGVSGSYRGLDLYGLLYDKDIGASTLLSEITVKNVSGESKTLTYNELTGSGKRIILAYGSGTADNAKPLGLADGGPMRLVIDGGAGADCITNVSEIAVSAATITAWKHNFGVYTQYADYVLEVSGQNLIHNKDYTIAELEAMDNIIVQDSYKVGSNTVVVQGLELYKLLQNIGFAEGMESSVFSVYATDGYYMDFTARQLQDGINGKPVLVAFGQGTNVNNGLPLVPDENSPGYDFVSDNQGGPLRFIVEDNSGWSVKFLKRIVVGQAGGNPDPGLIKDFDIHGLKGGATGYSVKELSELQNGMGTKIDTYSYVSGGNTITDTVKGVYLHDLLKMNGVSDNATVTVHTSDRFEATANGANYRDIPMSEIIGMKYFVAYEAGAGESGLSAIADVRNGITAKVRIYRKYDDPPTRMNRMTDVIGVTVADFLFNTYLAGENGFPVPGVRDVALDGSGGVWIGTDGGGAVHISADGAMTLYTTDTSPALRSNTVTSVSIDPSGGVWLSQGGSSDPQGAAYFKDGKFEFYNRENSGLPNDRIYSLDADKDGAVWFATLYNSGTAGTFNGVLTKYAPSTGEWRSWTMEDGFPTVSGWVVKADDKGGAWITSYRDSTLSDIEWKDVSYAYVNAAGELKTYPIDVGTEPRLSTWSRSVAIDLNGGAYVVRSHGGHSPDNVGGYLDYISPDGSVTVYTGDSLIPDLKGKSVSPAYYPEIRTVFVDGGGDLWLSTNGLGVYRFTVSSGGDISFKERFSTENGSWAGGSAFDNVWSIHVTAEGVAYIGGNGGMAWANVGLSEAGDTVLEIYNGATKVKEFTQSDIEAFNTVTNNYSTMNTWPTYDSYSDVRGVKLTDILSAAGFTDLDMLGYNEIVFHASDGFSTGLKVCDLTAPRYYFNANGTRVGSTAPAVISFDAGGGKLYFGQLAAQEQTKQAFVEKINRIVIGGFVDRWGMPTASPSSGRVSQGDDIRLTLTESSDNAKIYYTLDGSVPTVESAMYNITVERWFPAKGMTENPPIKAPRDGEFFVTARIIGLGKEDGAVARFTYNAGGTIGPPPVYERVAVIITDNILGAEGVFTVRGLEEGAAKVTMDYKRFSGGSVRTESVTGVPLIELLSQYGVNNDDYVVSLIAQDGFDDNGAYLDIPISEIRDKDYLVAYEVNGEAIADPISGETNMYSFSRIYRNLEKGTDKDPTDWRNRLTNILFIIVQHTDYIGDATEETAVFKVLGAVDKPGYFSLDGLASYRNLNVYSSSYSWLNRFETTGTSEMTGIYIEELLNNVMKLSDNATSITLTAADSYTVSFDLDDNELGVYWANHEGNKLMLAWAQDGVPAPLRAVVPQIGAGHINRELWANGVVSLTVNASGQLPEKLPQGAPVGLLSTVGATSAGGKGRITGTTSAMEYLDSGTWVTCTDGSTEVLPGQYGVRYAETDTHYASITVSVSVAPFQPVQPPPQSTDPTVVLSVFNGTAKTKDFTQSAISALGAVTNNYSTKNTWPTYESFANVTGVRLTAILEDAGFRLSDISNREITFYAKDNYYATLKVSDLTTARYYFNASGTRVGAAIPTAISYNADGGRLFFGQLTAQEQTRQAFVGEIDRIVIGGSVGAWGRPGANPASGRVSRGDDIRLSLPGGSGDAKIYYTIALNNGTPVAPTVESAMYNVRADRWFDKDTPENPPIKAPSDGPFTISARIIGLGKNDGPVVTFAYNGATLPQTTDQGTSGQTTGGGLGGTASVTIEIDAVPLGDAPEKVFTVAELSDKIKSAAADASGTLELKITDIAATASSVKVTLEDASVKEMIDAGLKYLIINSPLGYTAYNTEALKSIHTQGVGKISFLIRKVEIEGLDEKLKAAAAGNDVYELLVLRGDKPIIGFGSGAVVTRLPYKLGAGQSAYGVKVWRLDESATVTELDSVYNSVRSYVQFMRSGNSYYMVGYDPGAAEWADNPFTDVVRGSWYHDSVRFMHGRGLMNGTSATLFNPNMTITRGMVVTILHRMAGSPNVAGSDNLFGDVTDGAWYAAAVKWASENDIVSGYGDGRFGPNDPITREQMAAILCRYAGFAGINTSDGVDLSPFTDAGSVSAYAAQPMGWAVASGIIQGSNNKLDPKNSATRAQVAVIFERFIKGMGEK